jgi:hypothetical protein
MIPAEHPIAPPDRSGNPHRWRTRILLVLLGVVLYTAGQIAADLTAPRYELPREVYQPSYPVTAPPWLESPPAPVLPTARPQRPPHPASAYTPGGAR